MLWSLCTVHCAIRIFKCFQALVLWVVDVFDIAVSHNLCRDARGYILLIKPEYY